MAVAIISENEEKFNIKFLIYMDKDKFGINVQEYVMNRWTCGHTLDYIKDKILKIKNYNIKSDEYIFFENSTIRIDSFTVENFIDVIIKQNYKSYFTDDKIHYIKYVEV